MDLVTVPGSQKLSGNVNAPASKSETIREVLASTLARGNSRIFDPLVADDTDAIRECCQALGARIEITPKYWEVQSGGKIRSPGTTLNCHESGSTLRFLAGASSLAHGPVVLTGRTPLLQRPIGILVSSLRQLGMQCFTEKGDNYPPVLILGGGLRGGDAILPGDESSQYVSALLFASPKAQERVRIRLSTPLESAPYVRLTLRTLRRRGIKLDSSDEMDNYTIPPNQEYQATNVAISGDYSSASLLMVAAAITNSEIRIGNLTSRSGQADERIIQVLEEMGIQIGIQPDSVSISRETRELAPIDIDVRDSPDLAPALAVLGCFADGKTLIRGTRRLRIKESDRASALESELSKMGAEIEVKRDIIVVEGTDRLRGAQIDSHGDHRIAMATVVAALAAEGVSEILDAQTISKSYPNFLRDLRSLGAKLDVREHVR